MSYGFPLGSYFMLPTGNKHTGGASEIVSGRVQTELVTVFVSGKLSQIPLGILKNKIY